MRYTLYQFGWIIIIVENTDIYKVAADDFSNKIKSFFSTIIFEMSAKWIHPLEYLNRFKTVHFLSAFLQHSTAHHTLARVALESTRDFGLIARVVVLNQVYSVYGVFLSHPSRYRVYENSLRIH